MKCRNCENYIDDEELFCEACLNAMTDDEKWEWIHSLTNGLVTMVEQFTGRDRRTNLYKEASDEASD